MPAEDGKRLMHCHLLVNGAHLFINDAFPDYGHPLETRPATPCTFPSTTRRHGSPEPSRPAAR